MFAQSMHPLIDALAGYGYDPTSMHAMPYDFRLTPAALEARDGYFSWLKARVEVEVVRTGQRAVVYAHSMGCRVAAYFFEWLDASVGRMHARRWVNAHVGMYVSNGGPYLGCPEIAPVLVHGKTMGLPIQLRYIHEALASAGGVAWLLPTAASEGVDGPGTPVVPWLRVESWGAGREAWPLDFGPTICCGAGSVVDFFQRAASLGDALAGDIAEMIRRAAADDPFVGDVFDPRRLNRRPPVDTVIAAYGVGRRTQVSATFRLEMEADGTTPALRPITPPFFVEGLEKAGAKEKDGIPFRRTALTWKSKLVYEDGLTHRTVVDGEGHALEANNNNNNNNKSSATAPPTTKTKKKGGGRPWAKSGDSTVTYASLSVVHDWLGPEVRVSSVPLRSAFRPEEAWTEGTYNARKRAAFFEDTEAVAAAAKEDHHHHHHHHRLSGGGEMINSSEEDKDKDKDKDDDKDDEEFFLGGGTTPAALVESTTGVEPRMTFFQSRHGEAGQTEVWEMDGVVHRDSSNHNVFIAHFLVQLDAYVAKGREGVSRDLWLPTEVRHHGAAFEPKGDQNCFWHYKKARCAYPRMCEYRYAKGDLHLSQSCRLISTRPPAHHFNEEGVTTVPMADGDCYWDYARRRCAFPRHCEYRYAFGDFSLWDSCRLRANASTDPNASTLGAPAPAGRGSDDDVLAHATVLLLTAILGALLALALAFLTKRNTKKSTREKRTRSPSTTTTTAAAAAKATKAPPPLTERVVTSLAATSTAGAGKEEEEEEEEEDSKEPPRKQPFNSPQTPSRGSLNVDVGPEAEKPDDIKLHSTDPIPSFPKTSRRLSTPVISKLFPKKS